MPTKEKNSVPKIRVTAKKSDSGSWRTVDNKRINKSLFGADPTSPTVFMPVRKQPKLVPASNLKINSIAPTLSGNISDSLYYCTVGRVSAFFFESGV